MNIRERITLALERADKSQRDLSKFMGLSSPTVSSMLAKEDIDSMKYLKAVEDLTGYRFEWLRTGSLPEKVDDDQRQDQLPLTYLKEKMATKDELIEELRARIADMRKYTELLEKQLKQDKKGF
jgi:transcriptional regulator with XRE-family HTH domain